MAIITSIEQQKKNKGRVSIYLDGVFYCGMKAEVAAKMGLKVGEDCDEEKIESMQLETEKDEAMDRALTFLSHSIKTEKQIRDKLAEKGYTEAVKDYVIERLEEFGLVDDLEYCKTYINSVKGRGERALRFELARRGVEKETIDEAFEGYEENGDEAAEVARKYLRGKELSRDVRYKAVRYLMSKGYEYETAEAAVKEACGETGDEED